MPDPGPWLSGLPAARCECEVRLIAPDGSRWELNAPVIVEPTETARNGRWAEFTRGGRKVGSAFASTCEYRPVPVRSDV